MLVEVGTTNRTYLEDYENAVTENTAAFLKVHTSNYQITGFTHEAEFLELAEAAHNRGICDFEVSVDIALRNRFRKDRTGAFEERCRYCIF